jgi:hypothetical protein
LTRIAGKDHDPSPDYLKEVFVNGSNSSRWAPISGIAFVAAYIVAMIVAKTPDSSDPADAIAAYYPDSKSHRVWMIVAAYILIGAGMLFLWFLSDLRSRLRAAEGDHGTLSTLAFGAGVVFVGLLSIGALALAAVPASISFAENRVPVGTDTIEIANSLGYGAILVGGMLSAAVMIFTVSVLTLRTGALPKWSAWVGFLAAIALLFAVIWIPQVALLIWTLCVSGAMLARPAVTTQAAYPAPTA